ncbi:hypothetical protein [Streptacidiphilus sp. PAMC 29251]
MSRQQRQTLDELLRHGPLDIGGDVAEEGTLGGVPVVTVETPGNDPSAAAFTRRHWATPVQP